MNAVIHRDTQRLEGDAETIEQELDCLTRDCSSWARKRAEQDLAGLMEDLKGVEVDLSLMLTDCISAGFEHGEKAAKEVFHDFRKIFGCVDTLFNDLKEARLQLGQAYIRPTMLDHLEVDCRRFRKLLGQVQGHLKEPEGQSAITLEEF
jgi:hypothetical protein